jgi:multiple sugar transport system ATP-binding protein
VAIVTVNKLCKRYDSADAPAVKDVSFAIADGEFMVLLGPSGCGKSTVLRMIAGLEPITSGTVSIDGAVVNHTPAKSRDIAMVFQSYALYPHMTVYDNLAFGLRRRGVPRDEIDRRVRAAAGRLALSEFLARKPHALSGGQRQRVALGRAIVRNPKVFLFDEPLSNLDAALRVSTRNEIIKQQHEIGTTSIYVTHDQVEAMTMGDRICVMNKGEVVQIGPPLDVYRQPVDTFVARFLGNPPMNLLKAKLEAVSGHMAVLVAKRRLEMAIPVPSALAPYSGQDITLGIRPEDLYETPPPDIPAAALDVTVQAVEPLGAETILALALDDSGEELMARVGRATARHAGERCQIWLDTREVTFFDPVTTKAVV